MVLPQSCADPAEAKITKRASTDGRWVQSENFSTELPTVYPTFILFPPLAIIPMVCKLYQTAETSCPRAPFLLLLESCCRAPLVGVGLAWRGVGGGSRDQLVSRLPLVGLGLARSAPGGGGSHDKPVTGPPLPHTHTHTHTHTHQWSFSGLYSSAEFVNFCGTQGFPCWTGPQKRTFGVKAKFGLSLSVKSQPGVKEWFEGKFVETRRKTTTKDFCSRKDVRLVRVGLVSGFSFRLCCVCALECLVLRIHEANIFVCC